MKKFFCISNQGKKYIYINFTTNQKIMNPAGKIFYLNYILNFLDNEYKIYHLLDETDCSQSILKINSNTCNKIQRNCYQFIYKPNYCSVRYITNNTVHEIEEKPWMKEYVQNNNSRIFNNQKTKRKELILEDHEVNYVSEINIQMRRKVFDKIVNNPNFEKKEYTNEDLFFICYSYGFSFMDNSKHILNNIIYLIINERFNLYGIYQEFFNFVSPLYHDSVYFTKLNNKLKKMKLTYNQK